MFFYVFLGLSSLLCSSLCPAEPALEEGTFLKQASCDHFAPTEYDAYDTFIATNAPPTTHFSEDCPQCHKSSGSTLVAQTATPVSKATYQCIIQHTRQLLALDTALRLTLRNGQVINAPNYPNGSITKAAKMLYREYYRGNPSHMQSFESCYLKELCAFVGYNPQPTPAVRAALLCEIFATFANTKHMHLHKVTPIISGLPPFPIRLIIDRAHLNLNVHAATLTRNQDLLSLLHALLPQDIFASSAINYIRIFDGDLAPPALQHTCSHIVPFRFPCDLEMAHLPQILFCAEGKSIPRYESDFKHILENAKAAYESDHQYAHLNTAPLHTRPCP